LFLRNRFGCGYKLSVQLSNGALHSLDLLSLVRQHAPSAFFSSADHSSSEKMQLTEAEIVLPSSETRNFPALFAAIEKSDVRAQMGILEYGLNQVRPFVSFLCLL
jgi:hypothetical protein